MARQPEAEADDGLIALRAQEAVMLRLSRLREARESMIAFTEVTMPHVEYPDDLALTRYNAQIFHRVIAAALEETAERKIIRLMVTVPPRYGKSELTTRRFPAWILGRDPYAHIIVGTYNQPFAESWGKSVRAIIQSPRYRQIFPGTELGKGGGAAGELITTEGGQAVFVGRGGSSTGRGADYLILDDPIKDRAEANSQAVRDEVWGWFNDTMSTRLMSDTGVIIIIQTRWHEDDLIGRLTDPSNIHFNEEEADQWKIINIPALAEDGDVLGRKIDEPLWPERFSLESLLAIKRRNPLGFSALYQQHPTPADGEFFKADMILTYKPEQLPKRLRVYAASDHAVGTKQVNDKTCMIVVGVDEYDTIWVLDCWWKRAPTDAVVEAMLKMAAIESRKPLIWWAESGHISKSIGPFLRKRMLETKVYINIAESAARADKMQRAQAINARAAMGKVRFPASAAWFDDARAELLKFPHGKHDDFVDALAHIGMGLDRQVGAPKDRPANDDTVITGTVGWVKKNAEFWEKREAASFASANW